MDIFLCVLIFMYGFASGLIVLHFIYMNRVTRMFSHLENLGDKIDDTYQKISNDIKTTSELFSFKNMVEEIYK